MLLTKTRFEWGVGNPIVFYPPLIVVLFVCLLCCTYGENGPPAHCNTNTVLFLS